MNPNAAVNAPKYHWAESDSSTGNYRATLIIVLALLVLVGTAVMIWLVWPVEQIPRTFLATCYVANYDDSVAFDLPFAEQGALALSSTSPACGAANVRVISSPQQLQGEQSLRQVFGSLVGQLRPHGSHAIREGKDFVLLYIRAYAVGTVTDEGEVQADILAESFRGSDHSGRVPLEDVFNELATLPAAAIVVLLDTSEIEHDLSLGLLANGFPKALETMLAENSDWSHLWVINSNSLLQPAHVSWRQQQTLLTAAVTPKDWTGEDLDRDGWVSLSEFYERTLRFCDFRSREQQTPLLLRGGQGLCRPEPGAADWKQAASIQLIQTVAIPAAESVAQSRRPSVTAQAVALRPAQQDPDAVRPVNPDDTQVKPANGDSGDGKSRTAEGGAGSRENESEIVAAPSFGQSPRAATWIARDRLLDRKAAGHWSPIDYAPGIWNIIQRELIALDRQNRMGAIGELETGRSEAAALQWRQYHDLFLYLAEPGNHPPPQLSSKAAVDLLKVWRSDPWQQRKRQWESDEALRPSDRQAWTEIQETLRLYSDAAAELTWWLDLAAGVRSIGMLEKCDEMRRTLLVAAADLELQNIDPATDHRPITSHRGSLELARNALISEVRAIVDRLARSQSQDLNWPNEREIDHLLRSPLLRWEARAKLENLLAELQPNSPVIARNEELVAVWDRGRQNNGGEGARGWGYCQRLAQSHDDFLSLIHDSTRLAATASPQIRDVMTLQRWSRRYQELSQGAELLSREGVPAGFARWRLAAISGPHGPRPAIPRTVEPALVIAPVLDPLRVTPTAPETLTLLRANQPQRFQPLTLAIRGGVPRECVLRVLTPAGSGWEESLQLAVEGRALDWGKLRSAGEPVTLQRGGKLNLMAMATGSQGDLAERQQIELQIAIGDDQVSVLLMIEPPRPDHVDLWVTTTGEAAIEHRLARRNRNASGDSFSTTELLAGQRALVAIPSNATGVPYCFWAVNQAREGRTIRARIYPVTLPVGTMTQPGRLTDGRLGQLPEPLQLEVRHAIESGFLRPWAEAIAALPAADHALAAEPVRPPHAVKLAFHTVQPVGTDAEAANDLEIPHGFLCLLEEVVGEPSDADPTKIHWKRSQAGGVWEKWIETISHSMDGPASPWDEPLIEISPLQYDSNRSKLNLVVRGKLGAWPRYGTKALPVNVTTAIGGRSASEDQEPRQWELTPSAPEAAIELPIGGTAQAETQAHLVHLSIGGFPRRVNYGLIVRGPSEWEVSRRDNLQIAELLAVKPVSTAGDVVHVELPEPSGGAHALVLLNYQDVADKRVKVNYQHIEVSARFDAPWTKFQDFVSPESWDRTQVVLKNVLDGRERLDERYSPQAERYRLRIDSEQGLVHLLADITDHLGLKIEVDRDMLDEGRYEVFARLVIHGEPGARSTPQRLIVDQTPPTRSSVRRRNVTDADTGDQNSLWQEQKFDITLQATDELTQVSAVQFRLYNASRTPTALTWPAQQVDPQQGIWAATIDAAELANGKLPAGRYFIAATSVDLAGNSQENNQEYAFQWMNRPRPVVQPPPPAAAGPGAAGTPPAKAKTHAVTITFTRNNDFPISKDLTGSVTVKNLPGPRKIHGSQIRFSAVPEGDYEVEATAQWDKTNYVGKLSLAVPRDTQGRVVTVNLQKEK